MTEQEQTGHTEDLPLEDSESESIVGGHMSRAVAHGEHEIARLEKEGYVEAACTLDGMLMYNPVTQKRVNVKL